jgi:hypothetical protein
MTDIKPTLSAAGSSPQPTTGRDKMKITKLTRKQKLLANPKTRAAISDADLKVLSPDLYAERLRQRQAHVDSQLVNPGDRSKLPDSALTPDLLQARQTNAFNAAPAAPGSSISNAAMKQMLAAATQQKFGPQETALKQQAQNVPVWFQAYRDQVAGARQQEQTGAAAQVGSLQQMAATAAGDTGQLAGAPMDAEGAARAQAAAQIRSAGIGNQAALAQNLGGNQDAFLQNQGILATGQQQGAQLAVGKALAQLAADKGTFQQTQHDTILSNEADSALKNALTTAQIGSTNATAANTAATTTKTQVDTTKSKSDQAFFDKHGYYPGTGKPAAKTGYGPGAPGMNKYGYTYDEWAGLSPTAQDKARAGKTKPGAGSGIDFGTPGEQGKAQSDLSRALTYAKRLKGSKTRAEAVQYLLASSKPQPIYKTIKTSTGGTKQVKVLNADGTPKMTGSWDPVSSAIASAALDAAYVGHLSPATVKKLHEAGIKVKALGIPTRARGTAAPAYKGPDQSPGDRGTN